MVFLFQKKRMASFGAEEQFSLQRDNIAEEIIHNAISAGVRDPSLCRLTEANWVILFTL